MTCVKLKHSLRYGHARGFARFLDLDKYRPRCKEEERIIRPEMVQRIRALRNWVEQIEIHAPRGRGGFRGRGRKELSAEAARDLSKRHPPPSGWPA